MKALRDIGNSLSNVAADAEIKSYNDYMNAAPTDKASASAVHDRQRERSDFINDVADVFRGRR